MEIKPSFDRRVKVDWFDRCAFLNKWMGLRIKVNGIFEKYIKTEDNDLALVRELEIDLPEQVYLFKEAWINRAENLAYLKKGDKFSATCRVSGHNLHYPERVRTQDKPSIKLDPKWEEINKEELKKKKELDILKRKAFNLITKLGFSNYQKLKDIITTLETN